MSKDRILNEIKKLVVNRLLSVLISKLPFMAFGPLSWIAGSLLSFFVEKILKETFIGAQMLYISIDVDRKKNAVENLIEEVNQKEGELTKDEIKEYNEKLSEAGRQLILFSNLK